jgi:Domain of unknown function (DUF4349)
MPSRISVTSWAALLAGAGLLLVAGCSGAAGTSSSSGARSSGSSGGSESFAASGAAPARKEPLAGGGGSSAEAARLTQSSQSIIYTASLTVRVRDTAGAAANAVADITARGGYTAAEQAQTSHSRRQRPVVSLTMKVPVAGYPAALHQLAGLGRQTSLSQQSTDVTEQVADVGSRVTSQQDAIAQLRTLLRRAGSVSGLLQVQEQISNDESALEALLAQQRALDHETTYATISVLLLGPLPSAAARQASRHGFAAGLGAGWRGFSRAAVWLFTALGVVLPFAVVLAILGGIGYAGQRRISRRRARPTQAS